MTETAAGGLSATQLLHHYRVGDLSPVEVVHDLLAFITEHDPPINSLSTVATERALERAAVSAGRFRSGTPRPLEGVPVVVKDLIDTEGIRTTYGSSIFADHRPDRDAAVVARILDAGALVIGKGATHEFAWGITTENPHYGPTRNPWSLDLVAGGSSGGSAAAVAAGFAPLALGTDTAGSIRVPAAFCGIVGFKPTFGRVDRAGTFPLAPSLDTIGPMARTVDDVRLLWSVLADPGPATGTRADVCADLDDLVVGVWPVHGDLPVEVTAALDQAAQALARTGAQITAIDRPDLARAYSILRTVVLAEGNASHRGAGLWPQRRDSYGPDVRAALERAEGLGHDAYLEAAQERVALTAAMSRLFRGVDVVISPVSGAPPAPIGQAERSPQDGAWFRERVMTCTAPQSLAGLPTCVVRAGFDRSGIPVGVQLTAPQHHDELLLRVARVLYEATLPIQIRWPPVG